MFTALPEIIGVPEISIYGLLLSIFFINYILDVAKVGQLLFYADDCKIINRTAASLESSLTNCLQWGNKKCKCFSESKIQVMVISRSVDETHVSFVNNTIVASDTIRDLGVTNNAKLKWDRHTLNIISAAYFSVLSFSLSLSLSLKFNLPKTLSKTTKLRLYEFSFLSVVKTIHVGADKIST